jgi:hypothetical protein
MKLIDVDSKETLEDFLTLKKRLNLYSFYENVMKKSVVTRMSLHSDKDVETYLSKSRSDDNEKMSCYRQFKRGFNCMQNSFRFSQWNQLFYFLLQGIIVIMKCSRYFICSESIKKMSIFAWYLVFFSFFSRDQCRFP